MSNAHWLAISFCIYFSEENTTWNYSFIVVTTFIIALKIGTYASIFLLIYHHKRDCWLCILCIMHLCIHSSIHPSISIYPSNIIVWFKFCTELKKESRHERLFWKVSVIPLLFFVFVWLTYKPCVECDIINM